MADLDPWEADTGDERADPWEGQAAGPVGSGFALNLKRGAQPWERALVGLKTTPEGRASALEAVGRQVITDKSGKMFMVDTETSEIFPVDPPGFQPVGDVASLSGEAVELAPSLTGPGKIVSQAARGAVGGALREGASALAPGQDYGVTGNAALGRAGGVAQAAAFGAGGQAVASGGGAVLRTIFNPSQAVSRRVASMEKGRPAAARGREIERATGVPLTPGQRTQARGLLTMEGMLRRHPGSADIVETAEARQMRQAVQVLDRNLNKLTRADVSPEALGNAVRGGFGNVVDTAVDIRSKQGRVDFGLVENLAAQAGNRNIVPASNTVSAVKELIGEFSIPGATPETIRGAVRELGQLQKLLETSRGEAIPPRTMQQLLQIWGRAASGSGRVFKDLDRAQEKMIAARVFGALQRDLDEVADAATAAPSKEIANALRTARDNWKANSQVINDLRDSTLARVVGADARAAKDPEAIADAIIRSRPSALRASMEILSKADPALAQMVKRRAFEAALEKAGREWSANVPKIGESAFSPAKFVTAMKQSPVWDTLSAAERKRLTINMELFGRIARTEGHGSPTAPLGWAWDMVKAIGGVATGSLARMTGSAVTLSGVVSARKLARVMFDPQSEAALQAMFRTNATPRAKARAAAILSAMLVAEESEDVRPDTEGMLTSAQPASGQ